MSNNLKSCSDVRDVSYLPPTTYEKDNMCYICNIRHEDAVTTEQVLHWAAEEHCRREDTRERKQEVYSWVRENLTEKEIVEGYDC